MVMNLIKPTFFDNCNFSTTTKKIIKHKPLRTNHNMKKLILLFHFHGEENAVGIKGMNTTELFF
jgi:hypothetical protein